MMQFLKSARAVNPFRWRASLGMLCLLSGMSPTAGASARLPTAAPALTACDSADFQSVLRAAPAGSNKEAAALWLDRRRIRWPGVKADGEFKLVYSAAAQLMATVGKQVTGAEGTLRLDSRDDQAGGVTLALPQQTGNLLGALQRRQLLVVQQAADGTVRKATNLQAAAALDDLYGDSAADAELGVTLANKPARAGRADAPGLTHFALWAPSAQQVAVCLYRTGTSAAFATAQMRFDPSSGIWSTNRSTDLSGLYYRYLVDVIVPGVGLVRNRVTDPYSISLTTDSQRSYIARLDASDLKPGWDAVSAPAKVVAPTDMVIYEVHVRDFSINDRSVSAAHQGKFAAFTETGSNGMRHLAALQQAGLTDIHLLPIFDIASVPERGCVSPAIAPVTAATADSESQQAAVVASAAQDCFNWGYDPYHFGAPEGSYATDADDGARRIIELRAMVMALHRLGLRVGMDVVYNHTAAAGQKEKSVLDRIVPGYYHRRDHLGAIAQSTCCDNTATEHRMMAKLMSDTTLRWARDYRIDSFRFDLMAHQPRAVMVALKQRLDSALGHPVNLLGEGWNFGEVADGKRFVQASQLSLNGTGIGTFSDRARDAVRGGAASDSGAALLDNQGYINGLVYDPNGAAVPHMPAELLRTADLVRVGLAGSLRNYRMRDWQDREVALQDIDYHGQPAGYVSAPSEVVNYVENHDNQTLFDINAWRLPTSTSRTDRARVQMLGAAINAFSQGIAYFHAGIDTLRSKSLDRNSFDAGDWFNRIDWTYQDNYFGSGLPPRPDNGADYALMRPLLRNADIKPTPVEIALARDMFRDLLKIRASSALFRLRTAEQIQQRLHFLNTGSTQVPTVLAAQLDGRGMADAGFASLVYLINVDKVAHTISAAELKGRHYALHPVHTSDDVADRRPLEAARYDSGIGSITVPPRCTVVFVEP